MNLINIISNMLVVEFIGFIIMNFLIIFLVCSVTNFVDKISELINYDAFSRIIKWTVRIIISILICAIVDAIIFLLRMPILFTIISVLIGIFILIKFIYIRRRNLEDKLRKYVREHPNFRLFIYRLSYYTEFSWKVMKWIWILIWSSVILSVYITFPTNIATVINAIIGILLTAYLAHKYQLKKMIIEKNYKIYVDLIDELIKIEIENEKIKLESFEKFFSKNKAEILTSFPKLLIIEIENLMLEKNKRCNEKTQKYFEYRCINIIRDQLGIDYIKNMITVNKC